LKHDGSHTNITNYTQHIRTHKLSQLHQNQATTENNGTPTSLNSNPHCLNSHPQGFDSNPNGLNTGHTSNCDTVDAIAIAKQARLHEASAPTAPIPITTATAIPTNGPTNSDRYGTAHVTSGTIATKHNPEQASMHQDPDPASSGSA